MFEKTKAFLDSFLKLGVPGFDIVVYKDGECVFRYMNGFSDLENKASITGKERYNIYSCSKPITAVAALQLWEKGLFSLEDKLSLYMPEFEKMTVRTNEGIKEAKNPILIKHLFEMTAGFDYNVESASLKKARENTNGLCPTRETMKYLAKEPLAFEPGTGWLYGLSHDVLASLVEVITGTRFSEYVKANIFEPLGMTNSTFLLPKEELEGIAPQYEFVGGAPNPLRIGEDITIYKLGSEYESGGAGCISTVDDYIKFLEALRIGDIILKKETVNLMQTDRLNEQQRGGYSAYLKPNYGYGLGVRTPKENGVMSDFGWAGAAGAHAAVDLKNGISIYYAQHCHWAPTNIIKYLLVPFITFELLGNREYEEFLENAKNSNEYKEYERLLKQQ